MGRDIAEVRRLAEEVATIVRGHGYARLTNFDWNERSKSVLIDIDQDKARQLGVSSEQLACALNSLRPILLTAAAAILGLVPIAGQAWFRVREPAAGPVAT